MKKILGILTLLCLAVGVNAQLLWKISGNGLTENSYLMGTHHLAPISIKDSIQGMQTAFDQTQQVYGELKMSEMQDPNASAALMQKYMTTETDTTFKSLFTDEEYEKINQCAKENLMFDVGMLPKVKPVFLTNNLIVVLYMKHIGGFNPQEQLDTYFQTQATEKGKKAKGLETMDFQLDLLYNGSSLKRQAETLICFINNIDENLELAKELTEAYMAQDLKTLEKISDSELCGMSQQEEEAMIDNRNKKWAKMLPEIMNAAPTFVAVGVLHLPGENGLLNLLKQQGYTVEPVK